MTVAINTSAFLDRLTVESQKLEIFPKQLLQFREIFNITSLSRYTQGFTHLSGYPYYFNAEFNIFIHLPLIRFTYVRLNVHRS